MLIFVCTMMVLLILAAGGLALRVWWPNSNKLTAYAASGDVSGVRLCLLLGVDPNEPERYGWNWHAQGQTPLTAAAQAGQVEIIRLLLENGADVNQRDSGDRWSHHTPLAVAASFGHLEACRVLLKAGADPNIPNEPRHSGWTALDWAMQAEQDEVAELLRKHGAVESGRRTAKP